DFENPHEKPTDATVVANLFKRIRKARWCISEDDLLRARKLFRPLRSLDSRLDCGGCEFRLGLQPAIRKKIGRHLGDLVGLLIDRDIDRSSQHFPASNVLTKLDDSLRRALPFRRVGSDCFTIDLERPQ